MNHNWAFDRVEYREGFEEVYIRCRICTNIAMILIDHARMGECSL